MSRVFREVSSLPVAPDGWVFDARTVTAEAIRQSLVRLGVATSRMKDLYDLWHILDA